MILAYFDDHKVFPFLFIQMGISWGAHSNRIGKSKQHVAANITRWRYLPTQRPLAPTEKCCTPLSAMVTSPFECNILEGTINKAQVCATHPPIHRLT